MKLAYYPGCSLHSTGVEYDLSTRKVCEALGVELAEVTDWLCCGSSPAHQYDELMSLVLPAKNLALAAQLGVATERIRNLESKVRLLTGAKQRPWWKRLLRLPS